MPGPIGLLDDAGAATAAAVFVYKLAGRCILYIAD
jgi:hypothetical protein